MAILKAKKENPEEFSQERNSNKYVIRIMYVKYFDICPHFPCSEKVKGK